MSDTDNEIGELNERILELERDINDLENERDDLSDRLDEAHDEIRELHDEIRELEDALQSSAPIEITRRHIVTLMNAIEAYGGTNSERADLAEVLRCVEAM